MKIKITPHAQYRLMERDIDAERVKSVIREHDSYVEQEQGKIKVQRRFEDKGNLTVIYKKKGSGFIFITAYYEN